LRFIGGWYYFHLSLVSLVAAKLRFKGLGPRSWQILTVINVTITNCCDIKSNTVIPTFWSWFCRSFVLIWKHSLREVEPIWNWYSSATQTMATLRQTSTGIFRLQSRTFSHSKPGTLVSRHPNRLAYTTVHHKLKCSAKIGSLHAQRRGFLTPPSPLNILPSPPLQRLNARRVLPYASDEIYDIIADVPSYSSFLPYCLASEVTAWSQPDAVKGKKWPQEAVLEVGWGVVRERFKSRIFCAPGNAVEAVWGEGQCRLDKSQVQHHFNSEDAKAGVSRETYGQKGDGDGILTHLWTRWTVKPVTNSSKMKETVQSERQGEEHRTEVALDIEFRFANPLYAAMSSAVVDGVADTMIEAFEQRVKQQLGDATWKKSAMQHASS
jgi:coenzyme Q-binding protein COQ10